MPSQTPSRHTSEAHTPVSSPDLSLESRLPGPAASHLPSDALRAPQPYRAHKLVHSLSLPRGSSTFPLLSPDPGSPRFPTSPLAQGTCLPRLYCRGGSSLRGARGLAVAESAPAGGLACGIGISHMERNSQALAGPGALGPSALSDFHASCVFGSLCSPLRNSFCLETGPSGFLCFFSPPIFCSRFWEFFSTLFSNPSVECFTSAHVLQFRALLCIIPSQPRLCGTSTPWLFLSEDLVSFFSSILVLLFFLQVSFMLFL